MNPDRWSGSLLGLTILVLLAVPSAVVGEADYTAWADRGIVSGQGELKAYYPSVVYDANRFGRKNGPLYKMWFGSQNGNSSCVRYATSYDGIHWMPRRRTPRCLLEDANHPHVATLDAPPILAAYGASSKSISLKGASSEPLKNTLRQNYPNPCNPGTAIRFSLAEPGWMDLEIYSVLGRRVRSFAGEHRVPGAHMIYWDGTDETGEEAAGGIYIYRIRSGTYVAAKKMTVVK